MSAIRNLQQQCVRQGGQAGILADEGVVRDVIAAIRKASTAKFGGGSSRISVLRARVILL
jgi:hypothetical protein